MRTAGYSGTPLVKKLGIKAGAAVAFVGAPDDWPTTLGRLPDDVIVKRRATGPLDVIVLFVVRRAELARRLPILARPLVSNGGLWVAWPKKSSSVATDLTFESVQRIGLDLGLVDNKICAIDPTWSGLRFVYRLRDRT